MKRWPRRSPSEILAFARAEPARREERGEPHMMPDNEPPTMASRANTSLTPAIEFASLSPMKTPNTRAKPAALPALAICYQTHPKQPHRPIFYASALPGELGKDWGYTTKPEGVRHYDPELCDFRAYDAAKPLTPYWQRRFRRNCERTGMSFCFLPVSNPQGTAKE